MIFQYRVIDRYNWNTFKSFAELLGKAAALDYFIGALNEAAIARDFTQGGTYEGTYEWKGGRQPSKCFIHSNMDYLFPSF